jgi:hypothetical protein
VPQSNYLKFIILQSTNPFHVKRSDKLFRLDVAHPYTLNFNIRTFASSTDIPDLRQKQESLLVTRLGRLGRRDLSTCWGMSARRPSVVCAAGNFPKMYFSLAWDLISLVLSFLPGKRHGAGVRALWGAGEQLVLPAQGHGTDAVLSRVVVER